MTGLLYLLNVACASGQSALGKCYAKSGGNSTVFNLNKAVAGLVVFAIWGLVQGFSFHLPTLLFGMSYGIFLCLSMHTGFKALAMGPMALTSIIASFSLIVPFAFGILFWKEELTPFKLAGIILLLISILLINAKKENGYSVKWLIYAVATLISNGICSVIQKQHQTKYFSLYKTEFMFFALLCVLLILLVAGCAKTGNRVDFKFSSLGIASGAANSLSNYIVLYLAATENASVLFPIVSIANIIAVWGIGVLFFKERLRALQTVGLLTGIISVVLLKL